MDSQDARDLWVLEKQVMPNVYGLKYVALVRILNRLRNPARSDEQALDILRRLIAAPAPPALPYEIERHVEALELSLRGTPERGRDDSLVRVNAYQLIKAVRRILENANKNADRPAVSIDAPSPEMLKAQPQRTPSHTCILDDGGTPGRRCEACAAEKKLTPPERAAEVVTPACPRCGGLARFRESKANPVVGGLEAVYCVCGWIGVSPRVK